MLFWLFGHKAQGTLAPQPGIEPAPPASEGKLWIPDTTGYQRSPLYYFNLQRIPYGVLV